MTLRWLSGFYPAALTNRRTDMRAGKLEANYSTGKGSVVFSGDFVDKVPMTKASILLDWVNQLNKAYEIALRQASEAHEAQED